MNNIKLENLSAVLKQYGHSTNLAFDPMLFNGPFVHIKYIYNLFDYREVLIENIINYKPAVYDEK